MTNVRHLLRQAALGGPPVAQLWAVYQRALGRAATPDGFAEALRWAGVEHPDLANWLARQESRPALALRQRLLAAVVGTGPQPPALLPGGQRRDYHGLYCDDHVVVALRRCGRGERATWHVHAGLLLAGNVPILRSDALAQAAEYILGGPG